VARAQQLEFKLCDIDFMRELRCRLALDTRPSGDVGPLTMSNSAIVDAVASLARRPAYSGLLRAHPLAIVIDWRLARASTAAHINMCAFIGTHDNTANKTVLSGRSFVSWPAAALGPRSALPGQDDDADRRSVGSDDSHDSFRSNATFVR